MKGCMWGMFVAANLVIGAASAQVPTLPDGADAHWAVEQPQEIVASVLFDPATV